MQEAGEYLEVLAMAIRANYQCEPTHRASIFVRNKNGDDETVWEGFVEVFDLAGHPESDSCYAWLGSEDPHGKIVTVLGNVLVDSPKRAVEAAIFMGVQPVDSRFSQDLVLLRWQITEAKTILRRTQMKSEDLAAAIQALEQTRNRIRRSAAILVRRKLRELTRIF